MTAFGEIFLEAVHQGIQERGKNYISVIQGVRETVRVRDSLAQGSSGAHRQRGSGDFRCWHPAGQENKEITDEKIVWNRRHSGVANRHPMTPEMAVAGSAGRLQQILKQMRHPAPYWN